MGKRYGSSTAEPTMNEFYERIKNLSPARLALLAVELQSRLDAAQRAQQPEPIAIIGMSCRVPGANTPEAYWELLRDGVDAISETPADRWNTDAYFDANVEAAGKMNSRWGGYVDEITAFEPEIFGISPREANSMDPQHRMLLECSWEALERAGIAPTSLHGSPVGVFVGICNNDYGQMLMADDPAKTDAWYATGNAHSIASGRISYVFGLQGPSVAVDTACSSSLVAIHQAVRSLRSGECTMALAGGVNALLSPVTTVILSRARMLAPDGRCKTFDESANGFVRSEGCGIIVLKKLSAALADGDRVLALIRGSALNQDGRSNGLTAPNGPSQVAVIQAALADARLTADQVQYVECHGTGTSLGDPIEVQALQKAIGASHTETNPLIIGSVKTNLGHLESAAGVAGLIKVILMMQAEEIPPHLHLKVRNPHIAWEEMALEISQRRAPWRGVNGKRIAGVSSFGFSGTNAHILLESADPQDETAQETSVNGAANETDGAPASDYFPIVISARTRRSLAAQVEQLATWLEAHPNTSLADLSNTLISGRTALQERLATVAESVDEVVTHLRRWQQGDEDALISGEASGTQTPKVAFLFSGAGAQYVGMGKELYHAESAFRSAIDRCHDLLQGRLAIGLRTLLFGEGENAAPGIPPDAIDRIENAQPALFAIQYALVELWSAWGIGPDAVAGHSAGEYAAAVCAGVLTLEEGLELVLARSQLMATLPAHGEMLSVHATLPVVEEGLRQIGGDAPEDQCAVAVVNASDRIVISGRTAGIEAAHMHFAAQGIETKQLRIGVAAHSPQVEPILDAFESVARRIAYRTPETAIVSSVGKSANGASPQTDAYQSAAYWRSHLRNPVRFADAVETLRDKGYRIFVEIGPHTTLAEFCRRTIDLHSGNAGSSNAGSGQGEANQEGEVAAIPSLRRNQNAHFIFQRAAAELFVHGAPVNLRQRFADGKTRPLLLPTYAFDRSHYWITTPVQQGVSWTQTHTNARTLAGEALLSPVLDSVIYEAHISADQPAFLRDHRVLGSVLLPSPLLLAMASEAARDAWGEGWSVTGFSIREGARVPDEGLRVQTILAEEHGLAEENGERTFQIVSRSAQSGQWTQHAIGSLIATNAASNLVPTQTTPLDEIRLRCQQQVDADTYYAQLWGIGLEFGPHFRGLRTIHFREGEALGKVSLAAVDALPPLSTFHPAALDASLHLIGAAFSDPAEAMHPFLLTTIDRVDHFRPLPREFWSHITVIAQSEDSVTCNVTLCDDHGRPYMLLHGLFLRRASAAAMRRAAHALPRAWLYNVGWREAPWLLAASAGAEITDQVERLASRERREEFGIPAYLHFVAALDEIALDFAALALDRIHAEEVAASQRRLYDRLVHLTAHRPPVASLEEIESRCDALLAANPASNAEVSLTRRCGLLLPRILRGEVSGVATLFPDGSNHLTEPLYRITPLARFHNGAVAECVVAEVRRLLADSGVQMPIRILEVGGGSASTTRVVLDALEREGLLAAIAYNFTDISPHFTLAARTEFGNRTAFTAMPFNIEAPPEAQGVPTREAQIVIAANVLHATADLRTAVTHLRALLAERGLALILEGVAPHAWVDVTFGTLPGWWHFADFDLRPDHPLIAQDAWRTLLAKSGIDSIAAVDADPVKGESVLLAARRASTSLRDQGTAGDKRLWLVAGGQSPFREGLLADLRAQNEEGIPVEDVSRLDEITASVNTGRHIEVLYLVGGDLPNETVHADWSPASAQQQVIQDLQALLRRLKDAPMRLWIVTQGAQSVPVQSVPVQDAPNWVQAAAWGAGRVVALEYADKWGGLIDLPQGEDATDALRAMILSGSQEEQFAVRNGRCYLPRLQREEHPLPPEIVPAPDAAWLITGGLGGLGIQVARRLAESGAGEIVLVGRTPLPPRDLWERNDLSERQRTQIAAIQSIEAQGARVHTIACDIADAAALQTLIDRFGADLPPLEGVVHCAADLSDNSFLALTPEQIGGQLRTKVDGAWNLHRLTQTKGLRHFVLFSSTTALLGVANLAHYAAANAALDALAFWRRSMGLPGIALNWGTWDVMRVASASEQANVSAHGLRQMESSTALSLMMSVLNGDAPQVVIADIEWSKLKPIYEARRHRPFLAEVADLPDATTLVATHRETNGTSAMQEKKQPELRRRLANAGADANVEIVTDWVRELVANTLGVKSSDAIHDETGLFEMGMDSLMSIDLKGRLEKGSGLSLPTTLTFNYPSVRALAGFIGSKVSEEEASASTAAVARQIEPNATSAETMVSTLDVDSLDEDDLTALLAQKLSRLRS